MFSKKIATVGSLKIGKDNPVRVQTMWESRIDRSQFGIIKERITRLYRDGLELIRFSVLDEGDVQLLKDLKDELPIPVVADIHFDYKLALSALESGIPKIRINPGNIGAKWKSDEIFALARETGAAVRIGLNSGSLPRKSGSVSSVMVSSALEYIENAEKKGLENLVISLKSSNVDVDIEANLKLAELTPYPIHLGVTEAGGPVESSVRSAYALTKLLEHNVGDTIRVSITGSIEDEVLAANEILSVCHLKTGGVRIISCPRCGRHTFDTISMLEKIRNNIHLVPRRDITIAIMGCQVNGPGEARTSDYAVTGLGRKVFIYKKGELYKEVREEDALAELLKVIEDDR